MSEPNGRSADDWFRDYCEANQRARQAEARAEKAEAMVDWLADKLETAVACPRGDIDLECPFGTSPGSEKCAAIIDPLPNKEVWGNCWKEAARRAVDAGEG